jgi:hypothetical protein
MIGYRCGKCGAERESPEEMKEKVEVCPSCGTLNRVPSAARVGGTVRCARCQKDFSREDKVKLYNRELVCDKCAAILENIETVALPEATDEDLAAPPPRSLRGRSFYSGWLILPSVSFFLSIPINLGWTLIIIWNSIAAVSVASCLAAVWAVAYFSFIIWVFVLYVERKRLARNAFVALLIVNLISGLEASLLGRSDWKLAVAYIIVSTTWILYFLLSKRVKETFVY